METTLGVSPGTRFIGIALQVNGKLIDWKVQGFPGKWSEHKLKIIIHSLNQYMDRHAVTSVCIKIPDELPVSKPFIQLVGTLNVACERKGIKPMYYTLSNLKRQLCSDGEMNKAGFAECVVAKHPELLPEYHKEKSNSNNNYYVKIFEAVAALDCYKAISRN